MISFFDLEIRLNLLKSSLLSMLLLMGVCSIAQIEQRNTNEINLDFECESCDDTEIKFLDKNYNEIDHTQIATWEKSYTGQNSIRENFTKREDERFYIEISTRCRRFKNKIKARLGSFNQGENPDSGSESDQIIDLELYSIGNKKFRSKALILVTDKDEIDDNFVNSKDGDDDMENDLTIYAQVDGKLRLTYIEKGENLKKIIDICQQNPVKES